ncbi:MAG: hypothetical protein Q7I92_13180, partial [Humidesulfovibrio sp.]|nr:hypothetical protein [Humidesulfovibrio sp.]
MKNTAATTPVDSANDTCRRCGTCCRKGGPALHVPDLHLFRGPDALDLSLVVTLRAGELALDQPKGRLLPLTAEVLNSFATAFVDGKPVRTLASAGEMRFPAGAVDLASACPPGSKHTLSLLVTALPLKAVLLSYNDTSQAREMRGSVQRRGLCGDVYLVSVPSGPRLGEVRIAASVRKGELTLTVPVLDLPAGAPSAQHAEITDQG